jgi:hypothetical protein
MSKKIHYTIRGLQIGVCIESLVRVGYSIYPVVLIVLFVTMTSIEIAAPAFKTKYITR